MPGPSKPFYKRWWFILLSFFVLLGFCQAAVGDRPSRSIANVTEATPTREVEAPNAPDEPPAVEVKPDEPAKPIAIGDTFTLGDFSYTIGKPKVTRCVGKGFAKKCASNGAIYIVVPYAIRNDGKETRTVLSSDFEVIDTQERTFRPSSEAETALAMSGDDKDLIVSQLQPGIQKDTRVAFEVPKDAAAGLLLKIPEKGLFGFKEVKIDLGL